MSNTLELTGSFLKQVMESDEFWRLEDKLLAKGFTRSVFNDDGYSIKLGNNDEYVLIAHIGWKGQRLIDHSWQVRLLIAELGPWKQWDVTSFPTVEQTLDHAMNLVKIINEHDSLKGN